MSLIFDVPNFMHYWKTALLTLLIFGLGGVAGGLITAQVIKGRIEHVRLTTPGPEVAGLDWIPQMLPAMRHQLNLTPEQVEKVRNIMFRTQKEIQRAREEWRLKSRNAIARSDEAIVEILSDEQKSRFEEFKRKRRSMFQQRGQNGPPLRPGDRMDMRRENLPPLPPKARQP